MSSNERTNASRRLRLAVDVFLIAGFFGLATGFAEAAIILAKRFVFGQIVWASRDHVWMAPLAYAILFGLAATLVAVVRACLPRMMPNLLVVGLFAFAGVLCLTLPFTSLSHFATAILAVGAAAQIARVANDRFGSFRSLAWRSAAAMAIVAILLSVMLPTSRSVLHAASVRALPDARPNARNLIVIILDTVRASSMGLYGLPLAVSDDLEKRAAKGVIFDRAIAPAPWTLATHAALFTGREPHELSATWKAPLDDSYPTIAQYLAERGYATAGFIANHTYTAYDSGLRQGFAWYQDYPVSVRQFFASPILQQTGVMKQLWRAKSLADISRTLRNFDLGVPATTRWSDRKYAEDVNAELLAWLPRTEGKPFFAFLNYYDAHQGYYCPPAYAGRFQCSASALNRYHASIAYLDDQLEVLFRELDKRGVLKNTIVVVTSDHGEQFGEHGLVDHANSLYLPLLHVPLIAWGPGIPSGKRVAETVSLRQLPATIAGLLANDHSSPFPGTSLETTWTRSVLGRCSAPVFSEALKGLGVPKRFPNSQGTMKSVLAGGLHYIRNGDNTEELYAFESDVEEQNDLASDPSRVAELDWFRRSVAQMTKEAATTAMKASKEIPHLETLLTGAAARDCTPSTDDVKASNDRS